MDEVYRSQNEFGVPSLRNVITNISIIDAGRIVGYGVVKVFAEAILLLHSGIRKRVKAESYKLSIEFAIRECKKNNIEYLYVISNMESFSQILRNRGFKAVPGELLMLTLEDESGQQKSEAD